MKFVLIGLLISGSAMAAGSVCQNLTVCQAQITLVQAQQAVQDDMAAANIARIQASISAMPSPTPSSGP